MLIDHNGIVESKRAVRITTNIFWNYWQVMYPFHLKSINPFQWFHLLLVNAIEFYYLPFKQM